LGSLRRSCFSSAFTRAGLAVTIAACTLLLSLTFLSTQTRAEIIDKFLKDWEAPSIGGRRMKNVAIACQGGGIHASFTVGVLSEILDYV
jgi:hypothetical protein